jgi:hypothetical protein
MSEDARTIRQQMASFICDVELPCPKRQGQRRGKLVQPTSAFLKNIVEGLLDCQHNRSRVL